MFNSIIEKLSIATILITAFTMLNMPHSSAYADDTKGQNPVAVTKLERDINLLGVKIGDTSENVRSGLKKNDSPYQKIYEKKCNSTVDGKPYTCALSLDVYQKEIDTNRQDRLIVYFSDPSVGNLVFGIKRIFNPGNEKISTDNVLKDLKNKFGEPSYIPKSFASYAMKLVWSFDSNGKFYALQEKDYINKSECIDFNSEDIVDMPDCKGKDVIAKIGMNGTLLYNMDINIRDHDLESNSVKNTAVAAEAANKERLKQQQEGSKNRVSF